MARRVQQLLSHLLDSKNVLLMEAIDLLAAISLVSQQIAGKPMMEERSSVIILVKDQSKTKGQIMGGQVPLLIIIKCEFDLIRFF